MTIEPLTLSEKITKTYHMVVDIDKRLAVQQERISGLRLWVTTHSGIFAAIFVMNLVSLVKAAL